MTVYLLYTGNAWLNTSSLQLRAVCTTFDKACQLAAQDAKDYCVPFEETDVEDLINNRQTYGRDENYLICECETDELDA